MKNGSDETESTGITEEQQERRVVFKYESRDELEDFFTACTKDGWTIKDYNVYAESGKWEALIIMFRHRIGNKWREMRGWNDHSH